MSYKINSDKLAHPLLKPILKELDNYFNKSGIQFFVIGATARDIVMEIHNEKSGRLTHDLDIAIAISNWDQYGSFGKTDPFIPQLNCRSISLQIDPFISGQIDPFCLSGPLFPVR